MCGMCVCVCVQVCRCVCAHVLRGDGAGLGCVRVLCVSLWVCDTCWGGCRPNVCQYCVKDLHIFHALTV